MNAHIERFLLGFATLLIVFGFVVMLAKAPWIMSFALLVVGLSYAIGWLLQRTFGAKL